ncbi:MAG TPA: hypothetical protein VN026_08675 [Bacteroidia bacterium]|jgi:hypothetical protein|nr:hypothetical protein [Bacteroidia bacterium]
MKNVKQYYKELGKLVYAVAIADGEIQAEERDKLHQFVLKELADKEKTNDSSGMNQAFYVDFEFNVAEEKHVPINDAIKSYARFVHANYETKDEALIKSSVKLLEAVASAYSKQKEKEIINSVKGEMRELEKYTKI